MAQEWCLAYGILPFDKANALNMIVCKRKGKPATSMASPVKSNTKSTAAASKAAPSNRRRKVVDDDDIVGDSGMGPGNDWEGVGAAGI